ncbi:UvrD-helicase domain-containing protein [Sphingopyxis sp. R3-92]|uniref:UvrD-helicase domain-containing protein n=1 Tax=Sphingopyxis sp. R3-92 TaxID=3158553 RepID=UPI003EE5DF99
MVDLLTVNRGAVTAPAGCGKTYLIADALKRHRERKPILVLTHTNAGVAALRARLDAFGVPFTRYRLATLDGWAMRLASTFPSRSSINPVALSLGNPGNDYPAIRNAAASLLAAGHVTDVIRASYARLIVDEYQDCSERQHAMVTWLAQAVPTCVLGDPLQAIFGFGGDNLPSWDTEVCAYFPVVAQLTEPWRWINAGAADLGNWLLQARDSMVAGHQVDVRSAPAGRLDWVQLTGANDLASRVAAASVPASSDQKVLIIGFATSPAQQRAIASRVAGAIVVEAVDLKDLVAFGQNFLPTSAMALEQMAAFADELMSGAGAVQVAASIRAKIGLGFPPQGHLESAGYALVNDRSYSAALDFLVELGRQATGGIHRDAVMRACIRALRSCLGPNPSFQDSTVQVREQSRLIGRPLAARSVGSTLLMKGLEGDVAVILDGDDLNFHHLYVAMTRGAKKLIVCSASPTLGW